MEILRIKLSNGVYKPILINNKFPIYLVLQYSVLKLKSKSYKTQYNHLYTIRVLLEYYSLIKINFPKKILNDEFDDVYNRLDNFISWIYHTKSKTKNKVKGRISIQTHNSHLNRAREFIVWCNIHYTKKHTINNIQIVDLFKSNIITNYSPRSYISLSQNNLSDILNLVRPDSSDNPFVSRNRLRNYVIVSLLIDTGIRLGELLKIKTDDIIRDGQKVYLNIINRNNDSEDLRKSLPQIKNDYSIRVIGISKIVYEMLDIYLLYKRKKNNQHSYLFTSDLKGIPLSKGSVSYVFQVISKRINIQFTPHMLRHYFAERMLKYLIEIQKIDMERAKDELRTICGWSLNSAMPNLYTRNYLSELANTHNLERIENEQH